MLKMTKLVAICLALVMTFSLAGCAKEEQPPTVETPAVTTEEPTVQKPAEEPKKEEPKVQEGPAVAAVDGAITFEDGQFGFIKLDSSPGNADLSELSIVDSLGSKALLVTVKEGKVPYVAIDTASLLGDKLPELRKMELSMMLESPSGDFYACSGNIYAYSGADRVRSEDKWSVYLDTKNPNKAVAELTAGQEFVVGSKNFFVLTKETDNGLTAGVEAANLIIDNIVFYDANGNVLAADASAGFDAPEGFGAADVSNLTAVVGEQVIEGAIGTTAGGWAQAITLGSTKNEGPLDPTIFVPGSVITVYYASETHPALIFQSWTEGAPETAGWASVYPYAINNSGTVCQFSYADVVAAFGTEDIATYLDNFNVGDTGSALNVTKVTVGMPAPEGFGWADLSNLETGFASSVTIAEATGTSTGWGQAVSLDAAKNEGVFDASIITPETVITVFYTSATTPELIFQSWTEGAPETAGWAKVAPFAVNDSATVCQYSYADIVASFGTEDIVTYLDKFNIGDTGNDLEVVKVIFSQLGEAPVATPVLATETPAATEEAPAEEVPAPEFNMEGTIIDGATGKSNNWGQAVGLSTVKNDGGTFDPSFLQAGVVITVYYVSETAPELICQSWTEGAPESAGWAKVAPSSVNADNNVATFTYEDMVAAFGSDNFADYLDKFNVGDTGTALQVYGVSYK